MVCYTFRLFWYIRHAFETCLDINANNYSTQLDLQAYHDGSAINCITLLREDSGKLKQKFVYKIRSFSLLETSNAFTIIDYSLRCRILRSSNC